jgi:tetratricopeptide (TPR) repeat protein
MSEWYDSQKKPSSSFRELLRNHLDQTNPRRKELTRHEATKLAKLEAIAAKLRRGENVQNRQLQIWLSDDEYAAIHAEWQEQLALREEIKEKPEELKRYEKKLRDATFQYNRAEGYSNKGKHTMAKKFYHKSESLCEDALEILEEIIRADAQLQIWFDREIEFAAGSDLGADLVSLPRVVTSRSNERQRSDVRIVTKREVKLAVVERAAERIGRD